jgi:hypothetical protein
VGCEVEDIRLDLEATFDMRVGYRLPCDNMLGTERLAVEARVTSWSTREQVLALAEEAHARCPLEHRCPGRADPPPPASQRRSGL